MAYGNPGKMDNPYSDGAMSSPMDKAPDEQEGMGETAVLPKSILMGKDFKPGDEVVLRIDAIHGDEVQVSYAPEKGKEEESQPTEDSSMHSGGGEDSYRTMME